MSMCGEVHIITVNYIVSCWGLGGAVLSGCVGAVVGAGVGMSKGGSGVVVVIPFTGTCFCQPFI